MKKHVLFVGFLLFISWAGDALAQNKTLGVGVATPNPNAALHVEAPTGNQGFILPRLTTTQRTATGFTSVLGATDNGLMVYDTDLKTIFIWDGAVWKSSAQVAGGPKLVYPYADTITSAPNNSNMFRLVYAGSATENVGVAHFENQNPNSGFTPIFGRTNSITNGVADFIVNNTANTNDGIGVTTNGLGRAGMFSVNNASNGSAAVYATTNGTGSPTTSAAILGETATAFSAVTGVATGAAGSNAVSGLSSSTNAFSFGVLGTNSGAGLAGMFQINNASNTSNALEATTNGTGGAGKFTVNNVNSVMPALWAETNSNQPLSAPIFGLNTGTGDAAGVFRINNASNAFSGLHSESNGTGPAFLAKQSNSGSGIYVDKTGTGTGIFSNHNGTGGFAGIFQNINTANNLSALFVEAVGSGASLWAQKSLDGSLTGDVILGEHLGTSGSAGRFVIASTSNPSPALVANTSGGGAAFMAMNQSSGNAIAGIFENTDPVNTYPAIQATTQGLGSGVRVIQATGPGTGMDVFMQNASSTAPGLVVEHQGLGTAAEFKLMNNTANVPALKVETNGLLTAASFDISNTSNTDASVTARTTGTGSAASLFINNSSSTNHALFATTNGTGNAAYLNHTGSSGNLIVFANNFSNVARIDKTGQGFFNGGTVNSGADVAEMFDVEGGRNEYEPGDVLVISETTDRTVEKSAEANSTRVAGVYATKPGVMLTEKGLDESLAELVPMGVIGVIPTKVCLENGPIKRGDLLVTSSRKGHAMKATPANINGVLIYPTGAILGKALENFDASETGLIKVLVNVK